MPVHEDFTKIRANMLDEYGEEKGNQVYHAWVNKCGYDDTKAMEEQKCKTEETAVVVVEKFEWTMPFRFYDSGNDLIIRGEALHPGVTRNKNLYSKEELLRSARSLIGARLEFLEHGNFLECGNDVVDAEFVEPDKVEYVARVVNPEAVEAVRKGEVNHVSPSIICRKGVRLNGGIQACEGMIFNGLCLVHRDDPAGPGDPKTTVSIWERFPSRLEPQQSGLETDLKVGLKMSEKKEEKPPTAPPAPTTTTEQGEAPVTGHGPVAGVPEPSIEDRVKTLEERLEGFQQGVDSRFNTVFSKLETLIQLQPAIAAEKSTDQAATGPQQMTEKPPEQSQEKAGPSQTQEKASPPPSGQGITKPVGELPQSQPGTVAVTEIRKVFDDPRLFTPQLREKAILRLISEKEDDGHD